MMKNSLVQAAERKGFNVPTSRVTREEKTQVRDIVDFQRNVLHLRSTISSDAKLDMVLALLSMGLYPNVCMHSDKRKV